jgi:hypothetical protein
MTVPGDFNSGDVLTAADMNLLPGGIVAGGYYASTDVSVGTTATTIASFTVTTQTDRRYLIYGNTFIYDGTTNMFGITEIRRGSTTMQQNQGILSTSSGGRHAFTPMREFTGTGSNDTYTFVGYVNTGTANVSRSGNRGLTFCLVDIGAV